MNCGIYKITECSTNKCYIGQSKNIEGRWKRHHKRFPPQLFDYEILVTCPIADLNELEILMIETFDSHRNGFNKTIGGTDIKVTHPSKETSAKISKKLTGKKRAPFSDEHKKRIRFAVQGRELPKVRCPHCNKSGAKGNMNRWHFSKCKSLTQ
jgi:hypothetical protein